MFQELEQLVTGKRPATGDPDRVLTTVLFTDIVGSTAHAETIGDERWRLLHDRHRAMVASHVESAGGQLIQTSGDGTFSVFPGPARAIHCAKAISHAVDELGMQIRAGVHTGECERTDGSFAGLAVHIGARVGAAAGAGEVWVSRTVRDLVVGSGIQLSPRGIHRLKGVSEPWELFSVGDADRVSVAVAAEPPRLKMSDRVVLAAARRAPGLVRALNRG
jgi:class 3 adenylate cyclase